MAAKLNKTVAQLKTEMRPKEFFRWMVLFEEEIEEKSSHSRQEYFLAMISFQIYLFRVCIVGNDNHPILKFEDFLLKFRDKDELERLMGDEELTSEKIAKKSSASKSAWLSFVGMGKDGKIPRVSSKKKTTQTKPVYKPQPLRRKPPEAGKNKEPE